MIDLRSDTVTKPTAAMREAMARADVGDDVYGDDPSVRALEARTAAILGKEDAVYMPTGTMTNQVALRVHTEAGDEILVESGAHVFVNEGGAPAGLSGILIRTIPGEHGIFTPEQLENSLRVSHPFNPSTIAAPTRLICLENTHNGGGGSVWPLETIRDVAGVARAHRLALHLDGARLWNASAASGVSEADYARSFDTVSVCFSKGLGAPIGSALAGAAGLIARARRFKQMFGGGFRQAGIVAAAALYALDNHRADLANDHERAHQLAARLSELPGVQLDPTRVETNIIRFGLDKPLAFDLVERCHAKGVHMLPAGRRAVRAVVHRDIDDRAIETTISVVEDALAIGNKASML
jgi:threonine aldolase